MPRAVGRGPDASQQARRLRLLVITDEDVPDDVAAFLRDSGHEVMLARDRFLPGTADQVIARSASLLNAMVVTWNRRHFKSSAKRKRRNGALSYPGMSVLAFSCSHPRGLQRLQELVEQVEAIYHLRVEAAGVRMIADVSDTVLRFED